MPRRRSGARDESTREARASCDDKDNIPTDPKHCGADVQYATRGWVGPVGHDNQRLVLAVGKESCDFAFHDEASSADSDHGQEASV